MSTTPSRGWMEQSVVGDSYIEKQALKDAQIKRNIGEWQIMELDDNTNRKRR